MSSDLVFTHPATTVIYTLSLHDALPISLPHERPLGRAAAQLEEERVARAHLGMPAERPLHRREREEGLLRALDHLQLDRKSTRLNSSHGYISYAVFCLKKKTYMHTVRRC